MQPIVEYGSLKGEKYWPWIGRGYLRLTWKENYRAMTKLLRGRLRRGSDYGPRRRAE